MADISTLARPYAKAVFELAAAGGRFDAWQKMLGELAGIAANEQIRRMLKDPRVSTGDQAAVFIAAAGDALDGKGRNLVKVLARYRRLVVLPAIEADFTRLRAAAENTVKAELRTAVAATPEQQQNIRDALAKRLGLKVELATVVDPDILGGAVIRAGDMVIDDSVRGKLERLTARVAH